MTSRSLAQNTHAHWRRYPSIKNARKCVLVWWIFIKKCSQYWLKINRLSINFMTTNILIPWEFLQSELPWACSDTQILSYWTGIPHWKAAAEREREALLLILVSHSLGLFFTFLTSFSDSSFLCWSVMAVNACRSVFRSSCFAARTAVRASLAAMMSSQCGALY